jgi:hypothetical protein
VDGRQAVHERSYSWRTLLSELHRLFEEAGPSLSMSLSRALPTAATSGGLRAASLRGNSNLRMSQVAEDADEDEGTGSDSSRPSAAMVLSPSDTGAIAAASDPSRQSTPPGLSGGPSVVSAASSTEPAVHGLGARPSDEPAPPAAGSSTAAAPPPLPTVGTVPDSMSVLSSDRSSSAQDPDSWTLATADNSDTTTVGRPGHRRQRSEKVSWSAASALAAMTGRRSSQTAAALARTRPMRVAESGGGSAGSSGSGATGTGYGPAAVLDGLAAMELAPLTALLIPGGPSWSQLDAAAQLTDAALAPLLELTSSPQPLAPAKEMVRSAGSLEAVDQDRREAMEQPITMGHGAPAAADVDGGEGLPSLDRPRARRGSVIFAQAVGVPTTDEPGVDDVSAAQEQSTARPPLWSPPATDTLPVSEPLTLTPPLAGGLSSLLGAADSRAPPAGGARDRSSTSALLRTISGFLNLGEENAAPTLPAILYVTQTAASPTCLAHARRGWRTRSQPEDHVFSESLVVVSESQPSSVVAFCLRCAPTSQRWAVF